MSLESGTYQIKSTPSGDTIGRDLIENRSFSPKAIVVQSSGSGFETVNTHWEIECWDKCYYLKIGGAAAGVLDGESSGEVVAIIKERFGGSSREWILRPTAGIGEGEGEGDVYHICDSDEGSNLVWTAEVDKRAPIGDEFLPNSAPPIRSKLLVS